MMRMFTLEFAQGVFDDLKALRAGERKRILDKIDEQLLHDPTEQTRNKKILVGLEPPWEHEQPVSFSHRRAAVRRSLERTRPGAPLRGRRRPSCLGTRQARPLAGY